MSYHDGSSSSSSPSSTPSSARQTTVNAQGLVAPPGFHYMPDGTLMSDAAHAKLYDTKIIQAFNLDLSDINASGEVRSFTVKGSNNSEFRLEIKNEDNYYYNFTTNSFQVAQSTLEEKAVGGSYNGRIKFPTVTDDDQYDIFLYAMPGTKHTLYNEVRFGDGSIDINSSTGSSSLIMQKVVYQYTDVTLTISNYSPSGTIELGSLSTKQIALSRGKSLSKTPFEISCSVTTAAKSYRIIKQPSANDVTAFIAPVIGSAPILLPGENEYPAVSNTDTVDGVIAGGVSNVKVVMDTNVADKMVVGDKITAAVSTDTVDGAISSGENVVMDNNVAGKMAVGDRITSSSTSLSNDLRFEAKVVTVVALDPDGDNAKEFSMSEAMVIADGATLTFSPKCNRSLTTVVALNPDTDNVKEFSMSQNVGLLDGVTLSFSNQMNFSWPINKYADVLKENMIVVPATNVTADTSISTYEDTITLFEGTKNAKTIIKNARPALSTLGKKPTVVKGLVTVQEGQVVFDKQQVLALAGDTLRIGGYGESEIYNLYGYRVKFSDLKISLAEISTTTTSAVSNSTSVPITSRNGIIDAISTVSGIGINPAVANPTVASGAGAVSGAGTIVLSAAQTLEDGITLTFKGAGQTATISGNIEVLEVGTSSQNLRFDVEKLLSIT
tara:strand:- start:6323 stop:8320 length:1998 start_codon:yes stop_codon:yes gene_type:complete